MLVEVSKKEYRRFFPTDGNPFISEAFIELNEKKQDRVIRLIKEGDYSMGLLVGLKDGIMRSPFSAPFGGFHYRNEQLTYNLVYEFLSSLKKYALKEQLKEISITLPPEPYQVNMNAKLVNAFIRLGFKMETPDLNNVVNLKDFNGKWVKSEVAQNCRKAIKNGLVWSKTTDIDEMKEAYDVIHNNRTGLGRKIHMTLEDILDVKEVLPVDFFIIRDVDEICVGAAVLYRGHEKIVQGVFMGGDLERRNLGVIDYMYLKLYNYYKEMGFDYLDMGASSLQGDPNMGLLRFKEIHESETSLRYTFTWAS